MRTVVVWNGNEDDVEALLQAITPDDGYTFTTEIHKKKDCTSLQVVVEADSIRSMRATIDDILACLSAAESALSEA